jgi:hypothetical protein
MDSVLAGVVNGSAARFAPRMTVAPNTDSFVRRDRGFCLAAPSLHERHRIDWCSQFAARSVTIGSSGGVSLRKSWPLIRFYSEKISAHKARTPGITTMRRVVKACAIATCLALAVWIAPAAPAQLGVAGGAAVAFRNDMKTPVIVQGTTIVNRMPKRGQALVVPPGKTQLDLNIPPGIRFYTIVDANQPGIVYVKDLPVPVQGKDLGFVIRGVAPKVTVEPASP